MGRIEWDEVMVRLSGLRRNPFLLNMRCLFVLLYARYKKKKKKN